ncbi:MAG: competence/damage-inducible protein A [Polyangiaceae bacterium]|nr:competence/damage-inducible protein A [Polyangiaceae bacterium]
MSEPTPRVVDDAALLVIGNELLSGKIRDENIVELARTLRSLGVQLARVVVVPDDMSILVAEVRELASRFGVLVTSGGIGPTHDDLTIEAVARAFDRRVVTDDRLAQMIRLAYGERCSEAHLRMALVPEGCTLATTPDVRWPTILLENVWVLPGVPEVFRSKLVVLRAWLRGPRPFVTRAVYLTLEEADVKERIDRVVAEHPEVEVGSYPKWFDSAYKTKLTFDARDPGPVDAAVRRLLELVDVSAVHRVE